MCTSLAESQTDGPPRLRILYTVGATENSVITNCSLFKIPNGGVMKSGDFESDGSCL